MLNRKFAAISLIITICLLFTSCTSTVDISNIYTAEKTDSKYHTASSDSQKVASSDFTELYIDKITFSVNVKDKSNSYTWYTLPDKSNSTSYAFGVTLYTHNGIYNLNTQDNSVAFSSATYKTDKNSVTVSYVLSDKKETANKAYEEITKNDIYVAFDVLDRQPLRKLAADFVKESLNDIIVFVSKFN